MCSTSQADHPKCEKVILRKLKHILFTLILLKQELVLHISYLGILQGFLWGGERFTIQERKRENISFNNPKWFTANRIKLNKPVEFNFLLTRILEKYYSNGGG